MIPVKSEERREKSEEFHQPSYLSHQPSFEVGVYCDMRNRGIDYGG